MSKEEANQQIIQDSKLISAKKIEQTALIKKIYTE